MLMPTASGLPADGHVAQNGNPLRKRRVRAEQAREHLAGAQRRDDEQRSRRRRNVHGNSLVVGAQLFQGADQSVGMAHHARARGVGRELALPGNAQLDQQRGNRRDDDHEQRAKPPAATVVARTAEAAENHGPAAHVSRSR